MNLTLRLLLVLSALFSSNSFKFSAPKHVTNVCSRNSRLYEENEPTQAPESYERNKDGSFSDKADVKETLSKLMAVLGPLAPSNLADGVVSQEKLVQDVEDGFSKILAGVRESSMTPMEKRMIITEANMILSDMKTKEGVENIASNDYSKKGYKIPVTPPATLLFSEKSSPYLLVYGPGVIGQEVMRKMKSMGKSIDLKIIDGEFLGAMSDKEIEFAVRNVKTIIIAADTKKIESKGGWFGGKKDDKAELIKNLNNNVIMNTLNTNDNSAGNMKPVEKIDISNSDWDQILNEKSLKKLLNATMKECNKSGNLNIKIVTVGKASKQVKSLTSFLGGENTEFDAEVILQCKQRGLGYGIIKVGTLINDDSTVSSPRDRAPTGPKLSGPELEVAQAEYINPVLFTSSRVEPGEFTRISLAVDAVLRSAAHPLMNSTISVLSSATSPPYLPTDAQWDDEFLRLDGPELVRIPLKFSSVNQAVLRIGLIVENLKSPNSGLVTPIEVERFENGVRVIFKPLGSSYSSKNDERKVEKKLESIKEIKKVPDGPKSMAYMSPEKEKEEEERLEKEKKIESAAEEEKKNVVKKSGLQKLEGGLEMIVESYPYRRIRVKRCLMGAQTIVKEESEAILLRSVLKGIQVLENDYRIALMTSFKV